MKESSDSKEKVMKVINIRESRKIKTIKGDDGNYIDSYPVEGSDKLVLDIELSNGKIVPVEVSNREEVLGELKKDYEQRFPCHVKQPLQDVLNDSFNEDGTIKASALNFSSVPKDININPDIIHIGHGISMTKDKNKISIDCPDGLEIVVNGNVTIHNPEKVRKQGEYIAKLVDEGKINASDVDQLVDYGVDKDAISYYKQLNKTSVDVHKRLKEAVEAVQAELGHSPKGKFKDE